MPALTCVGVQPGGNSNSGGVVPGSATLGSNHSPFLRADVRASLRAGMIARQATLTSRRSSPAIHPTRKLRPRGLSTFTRAKPFWSLMGPSELFDQITYSLAVVPAATGQI